MPFWGFCSVTNCYSAGLALRARLSTACPATPAMILSKQCSWVSSVLAPMKVRRERSQDQHPHWKDHADSQIQALGFVLLQKIGLQIVFVFNF